MSKFNEGAPTSSPQQIMPNQSLEKKGPATNQDLEENRGTLLDPRFNEAIDLLVECHKGNGDPLKMMKAMCLFAQNYSDAARKYPDEESYQLETLRLQNLIQLGYRGVQIFCLQEITKYYLKEKTENTERIIRNLVEIANQADELEKMRLLALRPLNL
jgi:hypothetical protein